MPGGFPLGPELCAGTAIGIVAASSRGTSIAANASANTLGSWVQLIASTSADAEWCDVNVTGFNNVGPDAALDLGIGSAGNEVAFANQLGLHFSDAIGAAGISFVIPCSIPAGSRVAARCQVNHINDGVVVSIILYSSGIGSNASYAGVDSFGFNSGTTLGTAVDAGAVANTKGSYAQLTASTARDYAGVFFCIDTQAQTTGPGSPEFLVDIAIGGAGSETVIIPNYAVTKLFGTGLAGMVPNKTATIYVPIPAGTRIAAAAQSSTNAANDRVIGITGYGIYQ